MNFASMNRLCERTPMTSKNSRGFTLIELMITVGIVGILAAIAYPSYKNSIARGARADAKAALLENSQFMERNFTAANRYDKNSAGNTLTSADLPAPQSPKGPAAAKYNVTLTVNNATPSVFLLTAAPTGSQSGDACGSLTLNQAGQKGVTGTASVDTCWNN